MKVEYDRTQRQPSWLVHYSVRGNGRDMIVQAANSSEARRTVEEIIPGAVVTGVVRK
jgi:hypothetical protein